MRKIHMPGVPNDYGLIEEADLNGRNRRTPIRRRLLADEEKVYNIQRLWTSSDSKFILVRKSEYLETNTNKAFTDNFLFRTLARQRSLDRDSRDGNSFFSLDKLKLILSFTSRSSCRSSIKNTNQYKSQW